MPLVAQATACYVAGLILGGLADPFLAVVGCLLVATVALLASRRALCALAMLAASGVLAQHLSMAAENRCLGAALHRRPFVVRLLADATAGSMVRAEALACGAEVGLFVTSGQAPMGGVVAADGSAANTRRGWVLEHASLTLVRAPRGLDALRTSAGAAIDRAFRDDAPLARALLIADKQHLSSDLKGEFARAGLAHLLAIAGLHIAVVALVLELVLSWCGWAPAARSTTSLIAIGTYVVMIGAPPAAVRAAAMLAARTISRLLQRPTSPWALLAIGASGPLLDPAVALTIGYQLSVVCVAGLIVAAHVMARRRGRGKGSRGRRLAAGIVGTTLATAASAPLAAATFGRVSLIAPISNVLAEPLFAALQPLLFCTMCVGFMPGVAAFLADAAHPLMAALVGLAGWLSSLPGASVAVSPDPAQTLLGAGASVSLLAACADRRAPVRWAACTAACVSMIVWLPLMPRGNRPLELRIARAGRGETIALVTPDGETIGLGAADRRRLGLRPLMKSGVRIQPIATRSDTALGRASLAMIEFQNWRVVVGGPLSETQQLELNESRALTDVDVMAITGANGARRLSEGLIGTPAPRLVLLMGSGDIEPNLARRLVASGALLLRTREAGSVTLKMDGGDLSVRVDAEDWVPLRHGVL